VFGKRRPGPKERSLLRTMIIGTNTILLLLTSAWESVGLPDMNCEMSYSIYQRGIFIGREEYVQGEWSIISTLKIAAPSGINVSKSELHFNEKGYPLFYQLTRTVSGAESKAVFTFENGNAVAGDKKISIHGINVYLLDNLFTVHYNILIKNLSFPLEEEKRFFSFIPQVQTEIPAAIRSAGKKYFDDEELSLYEIVIGTNLIKIMCNPSREVVRFEVPSQKLVALRDDYRNLIGDEMNTQRKKMDFPEEEVVFTNSEIRLSGVVSTPGPDVTDIPAIVFVSGSGKKDRDGKMVDMDIDLRSDNIAAHLTTLGFLYLRYDDRGVGTSSDYQEGISFSDQIEDAKSAIAYLRSRSDVDKERIIVIGHSAGALIAAIIASEDRDLAGVILMAMPGKPLKEILIDQGIDTLRINNADTNTIKMFIAQQKAFYSFVDQYGPETPVLESYLRYENMLIWFKEIFSYDPVRVIQKIECPILILQGKKDLQIRKENARILSSALDKTESQYSIELFPDVDHLFMKSADGNIAHYFDKSREIDAGVLYTISHWIERIAKRNF
jgi:uncharacterized protein